MQKTMNVLHMTHTDISSDSRILKEMFSLVDSSIDLNLHGVGIKDMSSRNQKVLDNIVVHSFELKCRKLPKFLSLLRYLLIWFEMGFLFIKESVRLKPKVVHCHDFLVLPFGVVSKILTGAKLIYDAHELESKKNGVGSTLGKAIITIEKLLWRMIDSLIVVSPSIDTWYNENLGDKRTEVILNSPVFDESGNIDKKNYLRERFGISENTKVFLYIGLLTYGRGIDLLINAFSHESVNSSLVFLGYGDMAGYIEEKATKYDNIFLHEAVPHQQVVPIAKGADVGLCLIQNVSLSDYYCLPNKLFEYSFAGITVLASNFPDIVSVVEKYGLGETTELKFESILKAVSKLEQNEFVSKKSKEDLFDLTWHAQAEKLIVLYKELLSGDL